MMEYTLALFVFLASGEVQHHAIPSPSLDACFAAARKFVVQKPESLGGVALGAGCVVKPAGRPS